MDYSQHKQIDFRRKFLKLFGAEIRLSDAHTEEALGIIKMKAWKLREDIRLYRDDSLQQELLRISARQIIDFGATYDVFDSAQGQPLFSLRRKGLKSTFVRDHWDLLDAHGGVFGNVQETSSGLALARRWLEVLPFGDIIALIFAFVPQTYTISTSDGQGGLALAGTIIHRKNPVIVKMHLDTTQAQATLDPRVCLSASALLSVIDAAKNN
ncbi:MAG: hypothetical protein JWN38_1146 [Candidatus Saccharibacteria bacterium]|nr:hypothetical protein [Candidatus Saccharibacteria bacterium]